MKQRKRLLVEIRSHFNNTLEKLMQDKTYKEIRISLYSNQDNDRFILSFTDKENEDLSFKGFDICEYDIRYMKTNLLNRLSTYIAQSDDWKIKEKETKGILQKIIQRVKSLFTTYDKVIIRQ